jgi:hypothetical protein
MIPPSFASNTLFLSLEVCPGNHVSSHRSCCCQSANLADSRRAIEGLSLPLLDRLAPDLVLVLIDGAVRLSFELSKEIVSFHLFSVTLMFNEYALLLEVSHSEWTRCSIAAFYFSTVCFLDADCGSANDLLHDHYLVGSLHV